MVDGKRCEHCQCCCNSSKRPVLRHADGTLITMRQGCACLSECVPAVPGSVRRHERAACTTGIKLKIVR